MRFIGFEREDAAEAWARAKLELENAPEFFRTMAAVDENDKFVFTVDQQKSVALSGDDKYLYEWGQ